MKSANKNTKMEQLLNDKFIIFFLKKNIKKLFINADEIKILNKITHKNESKKGDRSIVIEFIVKITLKNKKIIQKSIFCKAHSEEWQNKTFFYMKILYNNGFSKNLYRTPKPLSYFPEVKACFYEGAMGNNLLYYLKSGDLKKIKPIIKYAAKWISLLHKTPTKLFSSLKLPAKDITGEYPQKKILLDKLKKYSPALYKDFLPLYKKTFSLQNDLAKSTKKKIIFGDYHPGNIIIQKQKGICLIDFTDLRLGDPLFDIGRFVNQLDFMSRTFIDEPERNSLNNLFVQEYIKTANLSPTKSIYKKINIYSLCSCMRNIIYFFYFKQPPDDYTIQILINDAKKLQKTL